MSVRGIAGNTVGSLVRWSNDGLAFRTDGSQVYLIGIPKSWLTSGSALSVSPASFVFPVQPVGMKSSSQSVTLLNNTNGAIAVTSIVSSGDFAQTNASIPASAPNGNTITPIDPAAVTIGIPVSIGTEPRKLAISDNGQYLYVSLNGNYIRHLDLASQIPGLQFSLGTDPLSNAYGVADMKVLPGNSSAIAVARNYLNMTGAAGVAIYDNGIKRPTATTPFLGSSWLVFSNLPSTLYGVGQLGFQTMSVNAGGVTVIGSAAQLGVGGDLEFDNGLIYSNSGVIVEPQSRTLVGKFVSQSPFSSSSVAADSSLNLVLFLSSDGISATVQGFDKTNFRRLGSLIIPGTGFGVDNLVRWGNDGLAFRTDNQVYLVRIPAAWISPIVTKRRSQLTSQLSRIVRSRNGA